jgi:D-alanyl-D-alanine carboxypeptidase (penicillin-binding protein 5/6)
MGIGADGLKTGFIKESGYGLVGSAVQDGQRLIVVVLGAENDKERANDARRLLEWGFRNFESRLLFKSGTDVAEVRVFGGETRYVPVRGRGAIRLLSPRGGGDKFIARVHYTGPVEAPVKEGAQIARLKITRGDNVALEVPLYAAVDVRAGSLVERALDSSQELLGGWIRRGFTKIMTYRPGNE